MAGGFVGILSVDLHLPEAGSLKAKRRELQRVKQGLARRFACAVSEVDHHDLWQRAGVTLAVVHREAGQAEHAVESASRWLHGDPSFVVVGEERRLVAADDPDIALGETV